jgi:hypothetical protein
MASRVLIEFNDLTDVVSVYLAGTRAADFRPAPNDGHLLFETDAAGRVVGIELLGASALVPAFWRRHPDRVGVPHEILSELDRWLSQRWADFAAPDRACSKG